MFHIDEKGRPARPVCALLDGVHADPPRAKKPVPPCSTVALDRWRARGDAFVASKAVLLTASVPGALGVLIGHLLSCAWGMLS
ncbi:hypothetical protein ASC94_10920 [Massilia sp. Root418]|uniref:hypothetical protein n=1 Tax=Massilia sp. Root418 TaxID=1736532 RepID=UPI000715BAE9|nr:hypothetical protein [Massilia sp. Root418]KQW93182.1 hypothetical protein ASC94_10920 [Massilia sp. Root418]